MGAPNCFHDLFIEPYFRCYAAAIFCSVSGMLDQPPEMEFDMVLYDHFPKHWPEDLQNILNCGMPMLNEEVFLHPDSRARIVANLVFNIRNSDYCLTRTAMKIKQAYGRVTPPAISNYSSRVRVR